jgi:hypothetical protein
VDFKNLQVLIRADGGGSKINDHQIPGRVSRISDDADKKIGVIHDFLDCFDVGYKNRSEKRRANYAELGWTQFIDGRLWAR